MKQKILSKGLIIVFTIIVGFFMTNFMDSYSDATTNNSNSKIYVSKIKDIQNDVLYINSYPIVKSNGKDRYVKKTTKKKNVKKRYLGKFTIYAYCPCRKCCGHSTGITSSGTRVKQGRTIAVDKRIIPLGSIVYIKIKGKIKKFVAEDTGSGINGKKIDMFLNSHSACLQWGVKNLKVWIVPKSKKK